MNDKSFLTEVYKNSLRPVGLMFEKSTPKKKRTMKDYAERAKKQRVIARKATKKKSKPSAHKIKQVPISKRKKALWELCKTYTKLRDGRLCVSCKKRDGTQCGHFLPKSACNLVYKYYEKNLGRQCSYCNLYLKGNYVGYRKHQVEKWGVKEVLLMERYYSSPLPIDLLPRVWVEDKIKWYEEEIKKYENKPAVSI